MTEEKNNPTQQSWLWFLKKHWRFLFFILAIVLLWCVPFLLGYSPSLIGMTEIKEFIAGYGMFGPFVFSTIQILQVFFAPIPGQIFGFAGGYIFGWFQGVIYSMIGLGLGSFLVMTLSRKFGKPFIHKFNPIEKVSDFEFFLVKKGSNIEKGLQGLKNHGLFIFFLIMLLPLFPDDLVCFVAGLSSIRISRLLIAALIGRFPGMLILSLIGDGIANKTTNIYYYTFVGISVISTILVWKYREQILLKFKKVSKNENK